MFEHPCYVQLLWLALIVPLAGVITVAIKAYAKHQDLKLSLRRTKPQDRPKILKEMKPILEERRPRPLGRTAKPPGTPPATGAHDSSSA